MKLQLLLILFLTSSLFTNAQQNIEDSFRAIINQRKQDTSEVNAFVYLSNLQIHPDSLTSYAQQGLVLARILNYQMGEADCLFMFAKTQNDFVHGIQFCHQVLNIYESINDPVGIASTHLLLQSYYRDAGDYPNALMHAFSGVQVAEANKVKSKLVFTGHRLAPLFLAEIGQTFILKNKLDSAEIYTKKSIAYNETFNGALWGFPIYLLATIQTMNGHYKRALENFRMAIPLSIQNGFQTDTLQIFSGMSTLFQKTNELDSAIYYAQIVQRNWTPASEIKNLLEAINNLASSYRLKGQKDSAIKYIEQSQIIKDSVFTREKDRALQNIKFNEELKQREIVSAQMKYKSRVQLISLASGMLMLLFIAAILWRNNQLRQKAYALLQNQKQETDDQRVKAEKALEKLKATQAQLVHREKMASLGELTAGIAHEIQNPLNFVNNFSETNTELIQEAKTELKTGNNDEVYSILADLEENEKKINHHGKRADSIVKNMLEHSRTSKGEKQLTDLNALVAEYLRLAYHGFKAKNKSFNATIETHFEESIDKVNIIPQEIGRVLLNLFNNAFYAVAEKKKQAGESYESTVWISTKKLNEKVEIAVKDNGTGISQQVVDKIFQPFFTTKPTGEGTGLGLSLSYDIVKAHGGEVKVESTEGEGAVFTIVLPA